MTTLKSVFCLFSLLLALSVLSAADPANAAERIFQLSIENNRLPPDKRTLRAVRGDAVIIEVNADRALTLHVHALKIETKIEPGAPVRISLPTRATGRFPVEIHAVGANANTGGGHHGPPLAYFEVMPK